VIVISLGVDSAALPAWTITSSAPTVKRRGELDLKVLAAPRKAHDIANSFASIRDRRPTEAAEKAVEKGFVMRPIVG